MKRIVVASQNEGKLREIESILSNYKIVGMRDLGYNADIEENGATFYENALIKAKTVSEALGVPALADDSGLMVKALNGAPGIYSARYAGEECSDEKNNEKLLYDLQNATDRSARFVCCMVLYMPNGEIFRGEGETEGKILFQREGKSGFGYDPLFYSLELKKCFGLADAGEKNSVSHRFKALMDLKSKIEGHV